MIHRHKYSAVATVRGEYALFGGNATRVFLKCDRCGKVKEVDHGGLLDDATVSELYPSQGAT